MILYCMYEYKNCRACGSVAVDRSQVCISEEYAQLQNDWHCQLQSRAALTGDELQRERDDRAVRDAAAEPLPRSRSRWTLRGSKSKRAAPPAPAAPSSGTLGLRGRLNLSPTLVYP